jgi:hypothetical protein
VSHPIRNQRDQTKDVSRDPMGQPPTIAVVSTSASAPSTSPVPGRSGGSGPGDR